MSGLDILARPAFKSATATPRFDLYGNIHKALRALMADTLQRAGRLDADDSAEVADTTAQVGALLDACRTHLAKENKFVHTAIEARHPGHTERIAAEHLEQQDSLAALEAETAALRARPAATAAQRLYTHLARFVGDNLEHMHVEETQHNTALWAAYSDDELLEIHQRILASIGPAEMALTLRWMVPAMSPAERAQMLGALQQQLPPEAMRAVLELVRAHLDDSAWAKLARGLNLPQAAPHALIVPPAAYPPALEVLGSRITVLAANSHTRSHEVTLQQGDEGAGPPLHSHPWDESFFVTRGEVVFECAGQAAAATEGTLVHVPAGTLHGFRFGPGGGALVEIAGAGGRATRLFSDIAAEFPPGPPDLPRLLGVLARHGVTVTT